MPWPLLPLLVLNSSGSHGSFSLNFLSQTHLFIPVPRSSRHSLGTHQPHPPEKQLGQLNSKRPSAISLSCSPQNQSPHFTFSSEADYGSLSSLSSCSQRTKQTLLVRPAFLPLQTSFAPTSQYPFPSVSPKHLEAHFTQNPQWTHLAEYQKNSLQSNK